MTRSVHQLTGRHMFAIKAAVRVRAVTDPQMHHRSGKMTATAWILIAVTAVCCVLWFLSLWWVVRIPVPNGTVRLCYGCIDFFAPPTHPPGWHLTRFDAQPPRLLPGCGQLRGGWFVVIPLWIPAMIAGAVGGLLLWLTYRRRHGVCDGCGYDLRGTVSAVCPECGRRIETTGRRG